MFTLFQTHKLKPASILDHIVPDDDELRVLSTDLNISIYTQHYRVQSTSYLYSVN